MSKIIEVKHFKKSFGSKVVHKDVNLDVIEGECLGLLGGSGMGKSVLLRSLIGLEKPDSGEVLIDGVDIANFNEAQLIDIRKKVAYAFQGGALFDSMSVYENLAYPLIEHTDFNTETITKMVAETLAELGMKNTEHLYPADLSGGMQKRIGLARSIILHPKVVLYDEPTAGLDPYNTKRIQEIILQLKEKGVTSILVTHDIPTALAVCDRISMLSEGKVSDTINKNDLNKKQDNTYYKFITGEIE